MLTTVNISIPKNMYKQAKKTVASRGYSSISELIRDSLRRVLYEPLTENGFTKSFEDKVLAAETEPESQDKVWKTEQDVKHYFDNLRKELKRKK